jgi:hypothetical protein
MGGWPVGWVAYLQEGRLEEEAQARNHSVIFYMNFHCELNFIEQFWCAAKYFSWEDCQYSLRKLRETIPAASLFLLHLSIGTSELLLWEHWHDGLLW